MGNLQYNIPRVVPILGNNYADFELRTKIQHMKSFLFLDFPWDNGIRKLEVQPNFRLKASFDVL